MKTAFVTGASRGIGREVALQLAKKDYFVFLAARDIEALSETKKMIEVNNGASDIVKLDLLSVDIIKTATAYVKQKTTHLDILANIAGMYHDDKKHFFGIPFEDYPDDAIIKNINAILVGHILLTKYLVPIMDMNSCILNMSGTFDEGETGVISDFITKHGIEIFTKQLPLELKEKGIRANCIRPAFVYTESVKKFFQGVNAEEALDPDYVAKKIIETCENKELNGEIIELRK